MIGALRDQIEDQQWQGVVAPALASIVVAIAIGLCASIAPLLALGVIVASAGCVLLWRSSFLRAAAVILGGLIVLQSSADLSTSKYLYFGLCAFVLVAAVYRLRIAYPALVTVGAHRLLFGAATLIGLLVLSFAVAMANHTTAANWARDSASYWLLTAAIPIALDVGTSTPRDRLLVILLFVAGAASAAAFATDWIAKRGIASTPTLALLNSNFLPAAAVCLALAAVFDGRRSVASAVFATVVPLSVVATGTRSAVVYAIPLLTLVVVARGKRRLRLAQYLIVAAACLSASLLALAIASASGFINAALLESRLSSVTSALAGSPGDPSVFLRDFETQQTLALWQRNPIVGVGPGVFVYNFSSVTATGTFGLPVDTPAAILSRFGLLGTVVFIAFFVLLLFGWERRRAEWAPRSALLAFVAMAAAWALFSSPLDDHGLALGLIPLLALAVRSAIEATGTARATKPDDGISLPGRPRR